MEQPNISDLSKRPQSRIGTSTLICWETYTGLYRYTWYPSSTATQAGNEVRSRPFLQTATWRKFRGVRGIVWKFDLPVCRHPEQYSLNNTVSRSKITYKYSPRITLQHRLTVQSSCTSDLVNLLGRSSYIFLYNLQLTDYLYKHTNCKEKARQCHIHSR